MTGTQLTPEQRHEAIAKCLDLIREGSSFTQAAETLGIPASTLNAWLLAIVPDEYRAAQRGGVVSKLVDLAETLETASSHLVVSRTRETLKFWQWVAERRLPEFAPKAELSGPGGGPIPVRLDPLERARRSMFARELVRDAEIVGESSQPSPTSGTSSTIPSTNQCDG